LLTLQPSRMRCAALDEPEPLLRSFRQVRVDRQDHVLAKHSKTAYPLPWHAVGIMETIAEESRAHKGLPQMARAAYAMPTFLAVDQVAGSPCGAGSRCALGRTHAFDLP
jgi:hypothetical protein